MKLPKRTLIVDDEAPARRFLRTLLAAHPEIEVVGEAQNVTEAIEQFKTLRPDLIFLDIQMPKRDGFSLLPELIPVPEIIFVTAYDCFAVKAFEANAVDYLVKPVRAERLARTLTRLTHPVKRKANPFAPDVPIFLECREGLHVVLAREILCIQGDHNYSKVYLVNREKHLHIRRRMAEWTRLLPLPVFFRADRSTIVNLPAVKEIVPRAFCKVRVHFKDSVVVLDLGLVATQELKKSLRQRARRAK